MNELLADGLMTVAAAADFLSVSRSTLYELMDRGELFFVKIRRARRIPKRAVIELAQANLQGGENVVDNASGESSVSSPSSTLKLLERQHG